LGDLGGRVPRARERRRELGVRRLGIDRRCDPGDDLARGMKRVLEPRQPVELVRIGEPLGGIPGDPLEPIERLGETAPETRDLRRVALPVVDADVLPHRRRSYPRPAPGGAGATLSAAMGGGHSVLVVDDEPSIRLLCKVNLELEGYRVLEA